MRIIDIREAKIRLSRLVERAAEGEHFIIARAGKPLVKVVSMRTRQTARTCRIGFMEGEIAVPDEFDRMGRAEIKRLFGLERRRRAMSRRDTDGPSREPGGL